jgi:hypothetical protein
MTQTERLYDMRLFLHAETQKEDGAILVSHDGDKENAVWLPKSQIEWQKNTPSTVLVTAPEWLVVEKGLDSHVI